jgi:hypothetical protein
MFLKDAGDTRKSKPWGYITNDLEAFVLQYNRISGLWEGDETWKKWKKVHHKRLKLNGG